MTLSLGLISDVAGIVGMGSWMVIVFTFLSELTVPLQQSRVVLGATIIEYAFIPYAVGMVIFVVGRALDSAFF